VRNLFRVGDTKEYRAYVTEEKLARFDAGLVHPALSTFYLVKEAEWCCRLFVLDMLEEGEEGIGVFVSAKHLSPAPLGALVVYRATLEKVEKNQIDCAYQVFWGQTLIAEGKQSQKIINKAKFDATLNALLEQVKTAQ
jgi:predicted thioesterase